MIRLAIIEGAFTNNTHVSMAIPNIPSVIACGCLCMPDDGCLGFLYDNTTLLCKLEKECRLFVLYGFYVQIETTKILSLHKNTLSSRNSKINLKHILRFQK